MSLTTIAAPEDRSLFSLHPEDQVTQQDSHDEQLTYLKAALRRVLPDLFVGREIAVYWIPGQRQHPYTGPDILIARSRPAQEDPSVFLTYEDGPLTFVAEVASEKTRARERRKRDRVYASALRVPEYLFIDLQRDVLELWTLAGAEYQRVTANAQGWLWSQELGVGFVWQEDRRLVRVVDQNGNIVPTFQEETARRQEETARRAAAEQQALREAQRAMRETQRAEQEAQRAEREAQRAENEAAQRADAEARARAAEQSAAAERERAEALAAELERLRREMRQRGDSGQ